MIDKIKRALKETILGIPEQSSISERQALRKRLSFHDGQSLMVPIYNSDNVSQKNEVIDYAERYQPHPFSDRFHGTYPVTTIKRVDAKAS